MLFRGKLFAGALCAGLLFGATPSGGIPSGGGISAGGGRIGLSVMVRRGEGLSRSTFLARMERERIKDQNEMVVQLVAAIVSSGMLE